MQHMEKLYNKGYLSYPRTETTRYNPTINLFQIVSSLTRNNDFGNYAERVANKELWAGPKKGKHDDKVSAIAPTRTSVLTMFTFDRRIHRSIQLKMRTGRRSLPMSGGFTTCSPVISWRQSAKMQSWRRLRSRLQWEENTSTRKVSLWKSRIGLRSFTGTSRWRTRCPTSSRGRL